jgi:signal transduction histidine kinase
MPIRTTGRSPHATILILDGTPEHLDMPGLLAVEGYTILTATTGAEGLSLARDRAPDLFLLTDVDDQFVQTLRRERPEAAVLLLAPESQRDPTHGRSTRYDGVIRHYPPDPAEVREAVRRALEVVQLRRDNLRLQQELLLASQQLRDYSAHLEENLEELRAVNERLKELNQSNAVFVSIVSHELRHPLTVAKGYLELVIGSDARLDDETRGFLEIAEQNLKNLSKLLDDLLDLSRIEAGHYHIDRQPERLDVLIHRTIRSRAAEANARSIKLESALAENLPRVSADPLRITQVLSNLVDNALKFTPEGGCVTISAHRLARAVEVMVGDTGIGIPAAELEKVFERFYQIKNPALAPQEGAGLGLAICREIVRLHNGQIWATSAEGGGAQLHFTLPIVE